MIEAREQAARTVWNEQGESCWREGAFEGYTSRNLGVLCCGPVF